MAWIICKDTKRMSTPFLICRKWAITALASTAHPSSQ
jgi:hypothetical protein